MERGGNESCRDGSEKVESRTSSEVLEERAAFMSCQRGRVKDETAKGNKNVGAGVKNEQTKARAGHWQG